MSRRRSTLKPWGIPSTLPAASVSPIEHLGMELSDVVARLQNMVERTAISGVGHDIETRLAVAVLALDGLASELDPCRTLPQPGDRRGRG